MKNARNEHSKRPQAEPVYYAYKDEHGDIRATHDPDKVSDDVVFVGNYKEVVNFVYSSWAKTTS